MATLGTGSFTTNSHVPIPSALTTAEEWAEKTTWGRDEDAITLLAQEEVLEEFRMFWDVGLYLLDFEREEGSIILIRYAHIPC